MNIHRRGGMMTFIVIFAGLLVILYCYFNVSVLQKKLNAKEETILNLRQHKQEIKNQLKVVYTHTTKLEDALKREKEKHREAQHAISVQNEEFKVNISKANHEAHNRFNALDTDYKMLKSSHEEIQQNHAALQQQYVRLSDDHKRIAAEARMDYDKLKEAKERESSSLQARIQDLFNMKIYFQEQTQQNQEYYENTLSQYEDATQLSRDYLHRMQQYQKEVKRLKEMLRHVDRLRLANITSLNGDYENDSIPIPLKMPDRFEQKRSQSINVFRNRTRFELFLSNATWLSRNRSVGVALSKRGLQLMKLNHRGAVNASEITRNYSEAFPRYNDFRSGSANRFGFSSNFVDEGTSNKVESGKQDGDVKFETKNEVPGFRNFTAASIIREADLKYISEDAAVTVTSNATNQHTESISQPSRNVTALLSNNNSEENETHFTSNSSETKEALETEESQGEGREGIEANDPRENVLENSENKDELEEDNEDEKK